MKMTLSKKLYVLVGILTAAIIAATIIALLSLTYAVDSLKRLAADMHVLEKATGEVQVKLGLSVEASRNYLVRTGDKYIDKFHGLVGDARKLLPVYERYAESEDEKALIKKIREELLVAYEKSIDELVDARQKSTDIAAVDDEVTISASPLRAAFSQLDESLVKAFDVKTGKLESRISSLKFILIVSALVVSLFGLIVSTLIIRKILASVRAVSEVTRLAALGDISQDARVHAGDEIGDMAVSFNTMMENLRRIVSHINSVTGTVAASSNQLSAAVQHITSRVDEQSGKSAQVAASSSEMSQTVMDIARNASNIASSATDTLNVAREGEGVVSRTVDEVQEIARTVSDASGLMGSLGDRSRQIGEIINVIKDIADQTNLLALNAAIEAARAGEQGRGFAVVADEVRKLAERTTKATAEIGDMIHAIQVETEKALHGMEESLKKVEHGTSLSREAGDALNKIVERVQSLQSMVQQIASATEEMSSVSEGINSDIETIAVLAHETNTDAEKISAESSDMLKLSEDLRGATSQFKL